MDLLKYRLAGAAAVALVLAGCATLPYVSNDSKLKLNFAESEFHGVTYVRAYERDGTEVVVGKLQHRHRLCLLQEYVNVAFTDADGQVILVDSVPMTGPSGDKQQGWYGASFRTSIAPVPVRGSRITLSVQAGRCVAANSSFGREGRAPTGTAVSPKPRRPQGGERPWRADEGTSHERGT